MARNLTIATGSLAYLVWSLVCAFAPTAVPVGSFLWAAFAGPPLLLMAGGDAWTLYLAMTALVALLLWVTLRSRTPELQVVAGFVVAVAWIGSGLFSMALSV